MTLNAIERTELASCEAIIERGIREFFEVGEALLRIRNGRLYRAEYSTFDDYCLERWGFTSRNALRYMNAAQVLQNLQITDGNSTSSSSLPSSIVSTEPLVRLEPDQQREAWQRAVDTAPDGKITAGHVQRVVDDMTRPAEPEQGEEEWPVWRHEEGAPAYCKYCYETHTKWEPVEAYVWECRLCHHRTADEFMQLGGPETQYIDPASDQWVRIPHSANGEEPEDKPRPAPLAVHFSSATPEHYTPREIIDATLACLEVIDLDPCSNSHETPNVPAERHYTQEDDGLAQNWYGAVYMNPPYGREISAWVEKLCAEHAAGNTTEAIALVPARTDTKWWQMLRDYPVCFVEGRLKFGQAEDSAPFPSAVFYLGNDIARFYYAFESIGDIWQRVEPGMFGE